MNRWSFRKRVIQPLSEADLHEVDLLFHRYSHKNYQLNYLEIPKKKMVEYLKNSLFGPRTQSICLREEGRIVGLISLTALPWMSEYFGLNLFSIQHLLTAARNPAYYEAMLRYVVDQIEGIDFLNCRLAGSDICAVHALENFGFRTVGSEVYLAKSLKRGPLPDDYRETGCRFCPEERLYEVLRIAEETHIHNRFMYDPHIPQDKAAGIYKQCLARNAFGKDYRLQILCLGDEVAGFIHYKWNPALSRLVGNRYASLDFIGVRSAWQNKGVGLKLNKGAILDLSDTGATHVVVRTFGSNYSAIRICHKIGFKITSTDLHFHYWVRSPAASPEWLPTASPSAIGL